METHMKREELDKIGPKQISDFLKKVAKWNNPEAEEIAICVIISMIAEFRGVDPIRFANQIAQMVRERHEDSEGMDWTH